MLIVGGASDHGSGASPSDAGGGICLDVDGVLGSVRDDNCEAAFDAAARVLGLPVAMAPPPLFPLWELALPLWGNGALAELICVFAWFCSLVETRSHNL